MMKPKRRDSSVHVYLSLGQWDEWEEGKRNCRLGGLASGGFRVDNYLPGRAGGELHVSACLKISPLLAVY